MALTPGIVAGQARAAIDRASHNLPVVGSSPARPTCGSPAVCIGIPFARSVNPVTGSNCQGTGVAPDVAVAAEQAYDVAYARALRHVLALDDVPPQILHEARNALASRPDGPADPVA